jgi:hypothetical protein
MILYRNVKGNKGHCYILTVIDVFSRYAWARPLKTKTGAEMVHAFSDIFNTIPSPPHYLQTDQGKEFENRIFQAFLQHHRVHHFSVKSAYKSGMVERFNRTLKARMFRYFTHSGTHKWVDVLPALVASYNASTHRSLPSHMSPEAAAKGDAWDRVWTHQEEEGKGKIQKTPLKNTNKKGFRVGDEVRISKYKSTFEKGYLPNWSEETFTVVRIDQHQLPVTYILQDGEGEIIEGIFYASELQKVSNPLGRYAVERVLRRGRGGKHLVKFLGYPGHYWVGDLDKI